MNFKTIAFVSSLVSAIAMSACGAGDQTNAGFKDEKGNPLQVVGSCATELTNEKGKVSYCVQGFAFADATKDQLDSAQKDDRVACENNNNKFSSGGCSGSNVLGACKGIADGKAISLVFYKSDAITVATVQQVCEQQHLTFYNP